MSKLKVLSKPFIKQQLDTLNLNSKKAVWELRTQTGNEGNEELSFLEANYKFSNFAKTWKFLNKVAWRADKAKHHPTIETTYNRVNIKISTHDVGNQVTYNDILLANGIQTEYYNNFIAPKKVVSFKEFLADTKSEVKLNQPNQIISELMKKEKDS